ncbi:hypothetical protein BpHYR1_010593 [Brachionus plicatilis]|uniref:Uncharacterized protein n=1 Tax=Brachionus plicatilis TaxID=10195 RepID=A0A3M7PR24_BRAPC|nr:hypothetical protein BpHYR1_010593 [Brachionus plicatilis]
MCDGGAGGGALLPICLLFALFITGEDEVEDGEAFDLDDEDSVYDSDNNNKKKVKYLAKGKKKIRRRRRRKEEKKYLPFCCAYLDSEEQSSPSRVLLSPNDNPSIQRVSGFKQYTLARLQSSKNN